MTRVKDYKGPPIDLGTVLKKSPPCPCGDPMCGANSGEELINAQVFVLPPAQERVDSKILPNHYYQITPNGNLWTRDKTTDAVYETWCVGTFYSVRPDNLGKIISWYARYAEAELRCWGNHMQPGLDHGWDRSDYRPPRNLGIPGFREARSYPVFDNDL